MLDKEIQKLRQLLIDNKASEAVLASVEALQKKARQESQQRELEISALLGATDAILKHPGFTEAARAIFDYCKKMIGVTAGYVALLDEDHQENKLLFLDAGGLPCTVDPDLPMPIRGLRREAYRTSSAVYDNSFYKSEWMKYMPAGHVRLDNVLFAPLVLDGRAVGLLGLANKSGDFTDDDARLATAFGRLAAVTLRNSIVADERRQAEMAMAESEARFRELVNNMSSGVAVFKVRDDGRDFVFMDINRAAERISGLRKVDVVGKSVLEKFPGIQEFGLFEVLGRVWRTGEGEHFPAFLYKDDRIEHWIENYVYRLPSGEVVTIYNDVTEVMGAQEKIFRQKRELEARNSELETLHQISSVLNRTLNLEELLTDILRVVMEIDIIKKEYKGGIFLVEGDRMRLVAHLGHVVCPVDRRNSLPVGECLCGLAARTGEIIVSANCENDTRHTIRVPGLTPHGHVIIPLATKDSIVGVLNLYLPADAELNEAVRKLLVSIGSQVGIAIDNARLYQRTRDLSLHDPLTGLANRRLMDIVLKKHIAEARRYGIELAVLMGDIDHFKEYNDTFGHQRGDQVLVDVARMISRGIRETDIAVRYGGEEFLVLLPATDRIEAYEIAERIRAMIEKESSITLSFGVAAFSQSVKTGDDLIICADQALYQAKEKGRNRVEEFCIN